MPRQTPFAAAICQLAVVVLLHGVATGEEFRELFPEVPFVGFVGDVKDAERVREVIAGQKPAIVFHAAAYKHVPLMEDDNCWQAVRNNVFGTYVVAAEAVAARVPRFSRIARLGPPQ